jgi:Flp pilus assembly protein CpaB
MNRKVPLVITSCVIGLLTAAVYAARIQHLRDEITGLTEKVPVLTAKRDLAPGTILQHEGIASDFRMKNQASKRGIAPDDLDLILGRRVFHPVPAGDIILWTDLPEGPRLRKPSEKIPAGYRAMSLSADETHTMVHFISPGDTVDIVSSNFTEGAVEIDSHLIAEKIVVLSVGQRLEEWSQTEFSEEYPLSVTLLATPEKALEILKASQSGEIHFLARGSHLLPVSSTVSSRPDPENGVTEH